MKSKDWDQVGIKSYMAIGLIAYLVVSTMMFVALMVLDSASASELAMQNVIATIVQATLAAAALFGVSIAVLYVAKNTDRNTERQALAHELAAETASLNRIEKYLLEVITPLWNVKNAIDDMFVFAKSESTRLSGFCVLDVEDARILQQAISNDSEAGVIFTEEEDRKFFDIYIISSILSGRKITTFGLDRNKILDGAYKAYKDNPDQFYREIQSYDSRIKKNQSAVNLHYENVRPVKEKEGILIDLVNNGGMEKPYADKNNKLGKYPNYDTTIMILSWYFLEHAGDANMQRLDFLDIIRRNKEFCGLVNPQENVYCESEIQSAQLAIEPEGCKIQADGSISLEDKARENRRGCEEEKSNEDAANYHDDVEKGFTGTMAEWESLRDISGINRLFTEIYCDKVLGVEAEKYLEKTLASLNDLARIMNETVKLLNDNIVPASYVTACLKMMYKEPERKFTPSSIETAVSAHALQIELFTKNIMKIDRYTALSTIQNNGLVDCHGKVFMRLSLAIVNVTPYVILDLIKPIEIENIKRKELAEKGKQKHIKEDTRSPFIDALKLSKGFIRAELNYTEIQPLDSIQKVLDTSIFGMSDEFWELTKEWREVDTPL